MATALNPLGIGTAPNDGTGDPARVAATKLKTDHGTFLSAIGHRSTTPGTFGSTTSSGSTTVLNDSTQTWATNQFAGQTLTITSGALAGVSGTIASNTANSITLSVAVASTIGSGVGYHVSSAAVNSATDGFATSVGGTAPSTLVDASKTWTTNQFAGQVVKLLGGTYAGHSAVIASNTSTTLTLVAALPAAIVAGTSYIIGAAPMAAQSNANNGQTITLSPQAQTGANANAAPSAFSTASSTFAGNARNDTVSAFGYNTSDAGLISPATDPFGEYLALESNYEYNNAGGGTSTAVTNTTNATLTDSSKNWGANQWANYTVKITSGAASGLSAKIASNTATVLTLVGTIAGLTGTPTYEIWNVDMEQYLHIAQTDSAGANRRDIRPFFWGFDRAQAAAQFALGTFGAITISSATNANPCVITTSVAHGLVNGQSVNLSGLSGTGWTGLNNKSFPVTVAAGATTSFSISINSTSFTGTTPGGTIYADPVFQATTLTVGAIAGLRVNSAVWGPARLGTNTTQLLLQPGNLSIYQAGSNSGANLSLLSEAGRPNGTSSINMYANGVPCFLTGTGSNGGQQISQLYSTSGVNPRVAMTQLYVSNTAHPTTMFGSDGGFNNCLVAISNNGGGASQALLHFRGATSQTGEYLRMVQQADSDTASRWFVDANFNTVLYGAGFTPATTDTNGFTYIPAVAGAQTGVPANVTGNYANSVAIRYDKTNHKLYVYDGAWRSTAALT